MIKAAVARTPILVLILMFMAVGYTIAHNKIVVVPLGADAGVSGYEIVSNTRTVLNATNQLTGYPRGADCPPGKKALGGGVNIPSNSFVIRVSAPYEDTSNLGWLGVVSLKGGQTSGSTTFSVYAICANTIN